MGPEAQRPGYLQLAPAADQLGLQDARAGLLDEAVVVAELRADLGRLRGEIPAGHTHPPRGVQVVPALAGPAGIVVAARGHRAGAELLLFVGPPDHVRPGDAVVCARGLVSLRQQCPGAELLAVPAPAQQRGLRTAILQQHVGGKGAGAQQQAAAVVAQRQRCRVGLHAAPGGAQAPARVGDRARVEGRQRQVEHVGALEEEGPLLRHAQREAGVAGELRHVELDLREVGVQCRVEHPVGAWAPLDLGAERAARGALARSAIAAASRAQRQLRPHRQQRMRAHALGDVFQPGDGLQFGDEVQRVLGQRRAQHQHAGLARDAARGHDAPRRAALVGVAQRHQRQAQLDAVAVAQALHGSLDFEVRREILGVGRGDEHAVGHHARRVDAHELRRAPSAHRVDHHRDEVLVAAHLVAAHQRRADLLGPRVPGADADHECMLLDDELQRGAVALWHGLAIQRQVLHEGVVHRRRLPGRFVQTAVDAQRRRLGWRPQRPWLCADGVERRRRRLRDGRQAHGGQGTTQQQAPGANAAQGKLSHVELSHAGALAGSWPRGTWIIDGPRAKRRSKGAGRVGKTRPGRGHQALRMSVMGASLSRTLVKRLGDRAVRWPRV